MNILTSCKKLLGAAGLLVLAACQPQTTETAVETDACRFDNVHFIRDFPGARLNDCIQLDEQHFQLRIDPAFQPVNPSAWYAFQVSSESEQTLNITLTASAGFARYQPKISSDGEQWQALTFQADEADMHFTLAAGPQPQYVAAQPLIVGEHYDDWLAQQQSVPGHEVLSLGDSELGRPLQALQLTSGADSDNKPWLVLVGRQHPPEITGALAFFGFANRLLADDELAQRFRDTFNILMIPNVNPDGVALGHWRHNSNGIDLNRDWHDRTQAETRVVAQALADRIQKPQQLAFALDFHSTNRNVYYSMPEEKGLRNPQLTKTWLTEKARRLPDVVFNEVPGDYPEGGVFKQFIADTYGAHAVTYEVGDNTDPEEIELTATTSAEVLMELLLSTN